MSACFSALRLAKLPKDFVLRLTSSAAAKDRDLVFVWVYIANDAPEQSNCSKLVGPTIATNTRVRLTIWNSPNNRLHIVRGWISADNVSPQWITDAAAVITAKAAPLSFDPGDSLAIFNFTKSVCTPGIASKPGLFRCWRYGTQFQWTAWKLLGKPLGDGTGVYQ